MTRQRILIVGPPGSGCAWLAERIHALTGIPVVSNGADDAGREWVRVAQRAGQVARAAAEAELVAAVRTPVWLRDLRLLMRRVAAPRAQGPSLRAALRATHHWDVEEAPRVREALVGSPAKVMRCASSEEVRAVLECVFGLDGLAAPGAHSAAG